MPQPVQVYDGDAIPPEMTMHIYRHLWSAYMTVEYHNHWSVINPNPQSTRKILRLQKTLAELQAAQPDYVLPLSLMVTEKHHRYTAQIDLKHVERIERSEAITKDGSSSITWDIYWADRADLRAVEDQERQRVQRQNEARQKRRMAQR